MEKFYKNTLKFITLLLVLFSFSKCQNSTDLLPSKRLTPMKKINSFGDSTYFSRIDGIRSWQNKFFIINAESQRIIILDTNLNFLTTVGQKGRGPGEILAPTDICKNKNELYITDAGNKKISVFTKYEDNYRLKHEFEVSFSELRNNMCFTIIDSLIYIVSPHSDKPIQTYSLKGKKLKRFGYNVKFETKNPFRKLFYIDSNPKVGIIAVSVTEPVIMQYNIEGNLLKRIDLSNVDILKGTIVANRKYYSSANRNSIRPLFGNFCLQENKLYLKLNLNENDLENKRNKVLVLRIDKDSIYPERILELGNSLVSVIGISSDTSKLLAFNDITGELVLFNL